MQNYVTILKQHAIQMEEKKSVFLAYCFHAETEQQVKGNLQLLQKEHKDATHICYAYSLGVAQPITRSNDDGEPAGSAGKPILEVILKKKLKNILVAVVRYFGGVELGKSKLTHMYANCAKEVINDAELETMEACSVYEFSFDYDSYVPAGKYFNDHKCTILHLVYLDIVKVQVALPTAKIDKILGDLRTITKKLNGVFLRPMYLPVSQKGAWLDRMGVNRAKHN